MKDLLGQIKFMWEWMPDRLIENIVSVFYALFCIFCVVLAIACGIKYLLT